MVSRQLGSARVLSRTAIVLAAVGATVALVACSGSSVPVAAPQSTAPETTGSTDVSSGDVDVASFSATVTATSGLVARVAGRAPGALTVHVVQCGGDPPSSARPSDWWPNGPDGRSRCSNTGYRGLHVGENGDFDSEMEILQSFESESGRVDCGTTRCFLRVQPRGGPVEFGVRALQLPGR
jgi:hypothetical protein